MGPYEVVTAFDNGSVEIKTSDGSQTSFIINGHKLRLYLQPISRRDFMKNVLQQKEMELVEEEVIPPPLILKLFCVVFMYICKYIFISLINKSHF